MNVTLKLPDELCKAARHRAIDESKSLSAWVAEIVEKEILKPKENSTSKTWIELLSNDPRFDDEFQSKDFPLEDRKAAKVREFSFED